MISKKAVLFLILLPGLLFSQGKKTRTESKGVKTSIPVQAQYSNEFKINSVYFNRKIDTGGRGEVLEVEINIENLTDESMDLYLFVVATYEKKPKTRSSFEKLIPPKERIRSFVPYPFDLKNFEYPDKDSKGNVKKDRKGRDRIKYIKFPKNPRAGIDPSTGKPYKLVYKKHIRTEHLSNYRQHYYFFNEVAILIFDEKGKPAFRQLYDLKGFRR